MSNCFWSLKNVISSHIKFDVFPQAQPIVFPANQFSNLINPKMPYKYIIVMLADMLKINNFWYIREPLVVEHPINLFSAFLQLYGSNFLGFQVCFL